MADTRDLVRNSYYVELIGKVYSLASIASVWGRHDEARTLTDVAAAFQKLAAALESAERDARRYRWLRDQNDSDDPRMGIWAHPLPDGRDFDWYPPPDDIDRLIDAAIAPGDERGEA